MLRSSPRKKKRQLSLTEAFRRSATKKLRITPVVTAEKVPVITPKTRKKHSSGDANIVTVIDLSSVSDESKKTKGAKTMMKKRAASEPHSSQSDKSPNVEEVREKLADAALKRATTPWEDVAEDAVASAKSSQASATSSVQELNGSQSLFSDSEPEGQNKKSQSLESSLELPGPSTSAEEVTGVAVDKSPGATKSPGRDESFRGPPISEFVSRAGVNHLSPLKPSKYHSVFFKSNSVSPSMTEPPPPFPPPGEGVSYKWDTDRVRMPCDPNCKVPVGKEELAKKWDLIEKALVGTEFKRAVDIETAIKSYNQSKSWSFKGMENYIETLGEKERNSLLSKTMPGIARLALRLPELITQDIPYLKSGYNLSLSFSQEQIACILANAFFCTWPGRGKENPHYPVINFNGIFSKNRDGYAKLSCIFHYFRRVLNQTPCGTVTYQRQHIKREKLPIWDESTKQLCTLHVSKEGTIEDFGTGMLQMDFANCYIGGGVLGHGSVQEEIRFMICPELLASMLFTERMNHNESVFIIGSERFSLYSGYASTFEWMAPFIDETPRDDWGRRLTEVVAVDALQFGRSTSQQYSPNAIERELNKLYCGFQRYGNAKAGNLSPVATGNWGCGVFGGDKELKSLIQIMAASETGRDVVYFTFDDESFMDSLYTTHELLKKKQLSVGDLCSLLMQYFEKHVKEGYSRSTPTLFQYIHRVFEQKNNDSDSDSGQK